MTDSDRADSSAAQRHGPDPVEWGDLASAAQAAGSLGPAWKKFIKTKFFVPILRSPDDDPKNFLLHLVHEDGQGALHISEVRERLDRQQGDGLVALSGADIVRRLQDQGRIEVALRDGGAFRISQKRVHWLGSGIEVTKGRIAARNRLRAAAPAAPLPVVKVAPAEEAVEAPPASVTRSPAPLFKARHAVAAVLALAVLGLIAASMTGNESGHADAPQPPPFEVARAPLPAPGPAQADTVFTAVYNSFSVSVPGLPEELELSPEQVRRMGGIETHQYRLRTAEGIYRMEVSVYRAGALQDSAAAMDLAQAAIVGADGTLIRATPLSLGGAAGREVRVRLPNDAERAARFVFVGNNFYVAMVTVPNGRHSAARIDAFLDSFKLN